jgi:hypothetical protein
MTQNPPTVSFMTALAVALKIVSTRALCFAALAMSFGLFTYAMIERSVISFVTAATFSVITYLPALWRDHKGSAS